MSKPYRMPSLGAGMEDGTVIEWHVEPGQRVRRGDVVGVVDTEKGAIEIEIWEDAEVLEIVADPGTKVPVGEPLLVLAGQGDDDDRSPSAQESVEAATPGSAEAESPALEDVWDESEAAPEAAPVEAAPRLRVSPVARRRARELRVELESLEGSGPGGAITLADVESAARGEAGEEEAPDSAGQEPPSSPPRPKDEEPGDKDRHAAMRKAIAVAMTRSKREIPHYYLAHAFSLERTLRWLSRVNEERRPAERLLLASLYLKAVAKSVREFPEFNGFWDDGGFRPAPGVHPGMAISLRGGGLVAPAIHDADQRSLEELTKGIRDLVQRARSGHLRGSEVADPTITLTSLGDRGVETVFGVIYPPQVAIVGVGSVVERPWAVGGMVGSHRVVTLTLAADHRASDGHRGSLFLDRIARHFETPEDL